eukprot:GFUD01060966.1.p1 GENE.GFUD01060966.1~~GFUD01060966.1.p1  ORF type:complete len:493 (-),score=116.60 GFUD01060966.1:254-1732(-)
MLSLELLHNTLSPHPSLSTTLCYLENRRVLVVRQRTLDFFLLDVPVQVFCQERSGVGLDCSFFSFNKKLIEHKVVKDMEGLARITEEIINMSYVACQGMEERDMVGSVHNFTFHQDILVENYKGQMVFRSKNCDFVMKNSSSKCCEHCFSLRIVLQKHMETEQETGLTLTIQELPGDCPDSERRSQKVLVTRSQDSLLLDTAISYSIPELKIPSFTGALDTLSAEEDTLTIVDNNAVKKLKMKKKSRGRPIVHSHSCPDRECNKRFSNLSALKKHQKDEHVMQFRCAWDGSSCSKAFMTESELKDHEKIHSGELPFQCNLCGHRFLKMKSLNSHKKVHLGIKPHVCDICEKAFIRKDQLQVHRSVHSGEKSFLCVTCGTSYTRQTHLIEHNKRIHVGEKRFTCKDCEKSFFSPQQLKRHSRVHNGEKPYECHVCKRRFSRSHHLKIHIKRLHSDQQAVKVAKPSLQSSLNTPAMKTISESALTGVSLVPGMF